RERGEPRPLAERGLGRRPRARRAGRRDPARPPAGAVREALRPRGPRRLRRLVPLQVGIVGLPNAGKTALFNALTHAGAEVTAYAPVTDKPNVGVATIQDDRLDRLAALIGSRKVTPAAVRVVDVPGTGGALLGGLRQSDALLAVADGFSHDADPERDLEAIRLEL